MFTSSTCTAYSRTASRLMSVLTTRLAMLRATKTWVVVVKGVKGGKGGEGW